MIIDKIKIPLITAFYLCFLSFKAFKVFFLFADGFLECRSFLRLPEITVVDMYISFPVIFGKDIPFHCYPVHIVIRYRIRPLILKCSLYIEDVPARKILASFDHYNEFIAVRVHELYVGVAEISPIQYKSCVFVSVCFCFFKHAL